MKSGVLDPDEKRFLRNEAFRGWEIVDATARLCAMNLLLHGISAPESPPVITVDDSLRSAPSEHFDMVLTNPPFGRKSSYRVINAAGEAEREDMSYLREDFWATTSNKQLNFLQHVRSLLTINGRAAIVVPDNVLFEGGAGETIRRKLAGADALSFAGDLDFAEEACDRTEPVAHPVGDVVFALGG
jgi:type I restriction enzyme M protein